MPFKSEAQKEWMKKNRPELYKEMEKDSHPLKALPDRIHPKKEEKEKKK